MPDDVRQKVLLKQQKIAHDTLMIAVDEGYGEMFYLDSPGGTDKMYLIDSTSIRPQSQIAQSVASTGIAATLLEGRTAHSTLKLPLNLQTIDEHCKKISNGES